MNTNQHPMFSMWNGMRIRCRIRGIYCCPEWASFRQFLADMGERPSPKHQIDREKNHLGYFPGNCRWVTAKVNMRNRDCTVKCVYNGEERPLAEWAELLNFNRHTVRARLKRGWSVDKAFETP